MGPAATPTRTRSLRNRPPGPPVHLPLPVAPTLSRNACRYKKYPYSIRGCPQRATRGQSEWLLWTRKRPLQSPDFERYIPLIDHWTVPIKRIFHLSQLREHNSNSTEKNYVTDLLQCALCVNCGQKINVTARLTLVIITKNGRLLSTITTCSAILRHDWLKRDHITELLLLLDCARLLLFRKLCDQFFLLVGM